MDSVKLVKRIHNDIVKMLNIFNTRIKKSNVGNVKLDVISFVLQSKITKNIIFF